MICNCHDIHTGILNYNIMLYLKHENTISQIDKIISTKDNSFKKFKFNLTNERDLSKSHRRRRRDGNGSFERACSARYNYYHYDDVL